MQVTTKNSAPVNSNQTSRPSIETWQAWAKVLILLGLGIYFGINMLSGNLTNYVNVRFAWLSYIAVGIFFLLGGAVLYGIIQQKSAQTVAAGHTLNVSWWVLAIVALPLVIGVLIPSQPLGASAVQGNISLSAAGFNTATAFNRAPLDRNVLDWLRVFNQDVPSSFDDLPADVTGFVYREPGFDADHFMVARFTLSCCVADASAIGLPVYLAGSDSIVEGEWVRVNGTFRAGDFRGVSTPILMAGTVDVVAQPEHPYLYP